MGRFSHLVDFKGGLESFKARYRIPLGVAIRYLRRGNGMRIGKRERW